MAKAFESLYESARELFFPSLIEIVGAEFAISDWMRIPVQLVH